MIKRICFFTLGFAENRLIRMKYYESIFPKNIKMFLFTTNKYTSIAESKSKWKLKRTKIFIDDYSILKTPFNLRKFCIKNKIERLVNLGVPGAGLVFIIANILSKRDYLMGYYGEVVKHKKNLKISKKIFKFFLLFQYWFVGKFAKKLVFTDKKSFNQAPLFFLSSKKKMHYAEAPVNTNLFVAKNKISMRKKLNLPLNKKIVLRVGRANYVKAGDIFTKLVEKNPEILFILIGDWFENEIPKPKTKNYIHLDKMPSEKLVDYYNSADISLALHRAGAGMGIVAEEALSCGIPIILPNRVTTPNSPAIFKTSLSIDEINKKMNNFLSLSIKEKQKISELARNYALKYLSDDVWKNKFIDFHLS